MNCPKCGKENPDDARICRFCNASITETLESKQPVTVEVSKLAIIALLLGILSVFVFFPPLLVILFGRIALFLPFLAIILTLISIIQIEKSGGKITGRAFAVAAFMVPIFGGIILFWTIRLLYPPNAYRMVCGTNLSRIGKMMLIYASDYDEKLPCAGGKDSVWSNSIPDWSADNKTAAFGLNEDGTGGRITITSSFYHLLKYAELEPKYFVCSQEKDAKEFKPSIYVKGKRNLIDFWDFGPEPRKYCSYSYHLPYGPYPLTTSCEPGLAVAAEPSPWIKAPAANPRNISNFDPDGDREKTRAGNAITHNGDGQNVLFMDLHVAFEKVSFCGVDDDNIYTHWEGQDIRHGAIPNLKSQPSDRLDSMLVNDLP